MKRLISSLLVLFAVAANGQTFEGTIKWSMKMELDPATQAKMDDAQKKMSDPATQAKMRAMQAQLDDPKMKAILDANPQMKAQMEGALKMMQSGDYSSLIPKGMIIRIKGQNTITKMDGGALTQEVLYLKDKDQAYNIDREHKTFSRVNGNKGRQEGVSPPKITKTAETMKILNYTCTKYIVDIMEGKRSVHQVIWATPEIKDLDLKTLAKQNVGRGQSIFYDEIAGVPLRVEGSTAEGKVVVQVTEIKKESQNPADFIVPTDFMETQPKMMGKF